MERMLVSHKNYRLQVFILLLFFLCFSILSESAWADTTLYLQATWTPPTKNSDGTPLTDLDHYNLYETNSTDSPASARIPLGSVSKNSAPPYSFSVTVDSTSGTLYFVITAVDSSGNESADSGIASYTYDLSPVTYTVASNPSSGPQITVDGTPQATPYTPSNWTVGTKHTLVATSPQVDTTNSGVRYVFVKWDNGSTSQTRQITVPSTTTTYTATFTTQYSLTTSVSPSNAGTVTPAGTTWYNSGKSVSVSAKANFGATFYKWSGTVPGSNCSMSIPMNWPVNEVANFTQIPEEVSTPTTPKNLTNGYTGTSYTFSTKSTSNLRNPVVYQYNWGDGTSSGWGPATQSHFWVSIGNYQVTVTGKSSTGVESSLSAAAYANIQEKPFIHVTSPNGGETWVAGTHHPITWDSNYLDPTGTIYLYYSYAGAWYLIASMPASSVTSSSYDWTVPSIPPGIPAAGSPVPKSHMAWTSIYVGNWLQNGTWQCLDTNDKAFKILDNGWIFTISGADKGGATVYFNADGSFDGWGLSLDKGMFEIQETGPYTVGANGAISGPYQLTDFSGNPLGTGNMTGTPNSSATTMALTMQDLSNPPVTVFTMSGVWLSELNLNIPVNWTVQISGSIKGTFSPSSPLSITGDVDAGIFDVAGSGYLSDASGSISITGELFFTPSKAFAGNTVCGVYDNLAYNGNSETGTFSGSLNPITGKFTFNLTSSNGNKYTFVGIKAPTQPGQ